MKKLFVIPVVFILFFLSGCTDKTSTDGKIKVLQDSISNLNTLITNCCPFPLVIRIRNCSGNEIPVKIKYSGHSYLSVYEDIIKINGNSITDIPFAGSLKTNLSTSFTIGSLLIDSRNINREFPGSDTGPLGLTAVRVSDRTSAPIPYDCKTTVDPVYDCKNIAPIVAYTLEMK